MDQDGFILFGDTSGLTIAADARWGVEYGVYEVLESYFGVRWLLPGRDGEFVPRLTDVAIDLPLQRRVEPSFLSRMMSPLNPDGSIHPSSSPEQDLWAKRMRHRGRVAFHHYLHVIYPLEEYTNQEKYPGWLSTTDPKAGVHRWQPCFEVPGVATVAIEHINEAFEENPNLQTYSIGVNDSGGFCEHPDYTERNRVGLIDYSDLYYAWANTVAEGVAEKFPHRTLGCMAYRELTNPPTFDLHPNIVPFITVDSFTLLDAGAWDEVMRFQREWADRASQMGLYDYLYGTMMALPRLGLDHIARVYRADHELGFRHIYAEMYENWAGGPKMYLFSKLMWDVNVDLEAAADDWYRAAVGPESGEYLKQYYAIWDRFWLETVPQKPGWFTANTTYLGFSEAHYLADVDPRDVAESRRLVDLAVEHTHTPDQRARAEILRKGWDYFEASALAYHSDWAPFDLQNESTDAAVARLEAAAAALAHAERRQSLIDEHLQDKRIAPSVDMRVHYKLLEGTAWGQEGFWSLYNYVKHDDELRSRVRELATGENSSYVAMNARGLLEATRTDGKALNEDPGFESQEPGVWMVLGRQDGSRAEHSTDAAATGRYGFALSGMDRGGVAQNVSVTEPGLYVVTALVRSVGQEGEGGHNWGLIEITLTAKNGRGEGIASEFYITKAVKPGWRRLATVLDLSQATDLARVQAAVTVAGLPGVREVHVDNLEVYRVDP